MPISDSNPHRRNLLVTSLSFILFHAAGGAIQDGKIQLLVANVTFTRPHVVSIAAWILLIWFFIRFWNETKFSFPVEFAAEFARQEVPQKWKDKLRFHGGYVYSDVSARLEATPGWPKYKWSVKEDGEGWHEPEITNLTTKEFLTFYLPRATLQLITGDAFANTLLPYVLFISAVITYFCV